MRFLLLFGLAGSISILAFAATPQAADPLGPAVAVVAFPEGPHQRDGIHPNRTRDVTFEVFALAATVEDAYRTFGGVLGQVFCRDEQLGFGVALRSGFGGRRRRFPAHWPGR